MTHSTGMEECLLRLQTHSLWQSRNQWIEQASPFTRRGVGIAAVHNGMGYGRGLADAAAAKIELTKEGKIRIYNSISDMGQGNSPTFVQIVCEMLGQDEEHVELVQPDTTRCLPSGSASAGRTTYTFGKALIKACEAFRTKLIHRTAMVLMVDDASGLVLLPGRVSHLPSGREIPFAAIASMLIDEDRTSVGEALMPVTNEIPEGGEAFRLGFPHLIYPYAAHLVRLEMDELTGNVTICDYLSFTDGGRVLNPQNFEQQIQGGIAQGLGYALFEDCITEGGKLITKDLCTYIIPGAEDLPDIESHAVETVEHSGPFGMKGIGEVGMNGPLPAVSSAFFHMGLPMTLAPFTPERLLDALNLHGTKS